MNAFMNPKISDLHSKRLSGSSVLTSNELKLTQNLRGTLGASDFTEHDESVLKKIEDISEKKTGALNNINFYPRMSNPYKGNFCTKGSYRITEN